MVQYHSSAHRDWCPHFHFRSSLVVASILRDLPGVKPNTSCIAIGWVSITVAWHRTHQEKRSGGKVIRDIIRALHWMPLQHLGRHILENPYEQVISWHTIWRTNSICWIFWRVSHWEAISECSADLLDLGKRHPSILPVCYAKWAEETIEWDR